MPWTARERPAPVFRSACFHSAPGQSSPGLARRLIPRTGYPAALNCVTTRRPSLPAPPVTRICCIVFPFLFLCTFHASQRLRQPPTSDGATFTLCPLFISPALSIHTRD